MPALRLALALFFLFALAPSIIAEDAKSPVQVFLLVGQSNMEGQAVVDLTGKDYNEGRGTLTHVLAEPTNAKRFAHLRGADGKWQVRDDVWCRYKRERGPLLTGPLTMGFSVYGDPHHFGPELQFGHVIGDHFDEQVLLIKTAWGGKSLYVDFRPPSAGGEVGPYYTKMLAEIRESLENLERDFPSYDRAGYELAGLVWYQGWNDGVDPEHAIPEYEQNLVHFIHDVRRDLSAPKLPVVIGELTGAWVDAPLQWETLRRAQAAVAARPEFAGNIAFAATRNFVRKPEDSPNPGHGHHEFGNAETYLLVGDALATSMLGLLNKGENVSVIPNATSPRGLEQELLATPYDELAKLAKAEGDAARGAIVFHQSHMACSKCHSMDDTSPSPLGPNLARLGPSASDVSLIESILEPSKSIRQGYELFTLLTLDGRAIQGLGVEQTAEQTTLRDPSSGALTTILAGDIDELAASRNSIMPTGQVNQLASRQQFYDLVRYLMEVRDGGVARANQLKPSAESLAMVLPAYEQNLDHAALIRGWNQASFERGEAIYLRVCANCHGTHEHPGSLPTSLRFADGKFKNGSDPLAIYKTITHGFGLMMPQTWMVPVQKYDVVHYIREAYLKQHNPSQYVPISDELLARLPSGTERGPSPTSIEPWNAMDYGPSLTHTYEIPGETPNFAYKGIAIRLDSGSGGVARGRHWMVFDTDTMRTAAAWSADQGDNSFIDWRGIQFNGEHRIHPSIVGEVTYHNGILPGWANPANGSFADDSRVVGRDGRRYGPLPSSWAKFRGRYQHGHNVVLSYSVGECDVLEMPTLEEANSNHVQPVFSRTFNIGPRPHELVLQVAGQPDGETFELVTADPSSNIVLFGPRSDQRKNDQAATKEPFQFDGKSYVEISDANDFDMTTKDFTIAARVKTSVGGTILALAKPGDKWTADGQTFFIRDGRLGFDIGWVGAVTGRRKVADNKWHDVAATWTQADHTLRLYVDGKLDGEGTLAAQDKLSGSVLRIGFTAPNFPRPQSFFQGPIEHVSFYQSLIPSGLVSPKLSNEHRTSLKGTWSFKSPATDLIKDGSTHGNDGEIRTESSKQNDSATPLLAGIGPGTIPAQWEVNDGQLRLRIAAGETPLAFSVWVTASEQEDVVNVEPKSIDLQSMIQGGPSRWATVIETQVDAGDEDGPLAVDILTAPESNPWLAQTRFTGLDFFSSGDLAVCTWDGDVWAVDVQSDDKTLRWKRIANGLFQPLGLKVIQDKIHVLCRDSLIVLHDLNGDDETDFYECLNNDHQVTEHFHEFAMGLQTDAAGNFYYAKSGRHALPAVVPHHGTLLRVSKDGSTTETLATGFRAANGVCLNPDGSFVVTDQEGFWNPKNRINWVTFDPSVKPKFYGNLFGYTDVTDTSDSAMEPPLCWITNAFDRSPAELLWVDSPKWGALDGALLNLSYGYGKVFNVLHEEVGGMMQGGMVELPMSKLASGVMRGRFHPQDKQLYACGMFAWAGNATHPGQLYRIRATGKPMHVPLELNATHAGLKLRFAEAIDPSSLDANSVKIKTWSLKRTANYGSEHHDEKPLDVDGTNLSSDNKTLTIHAADIEPTWCMEIQYNLRSLDGAPVVGVIHNTIHRLGD